LNKPIFCQLTIADHAKFGTNGEVKAPWCDGLSRQEVTQVRDHKDDKFLFIVHFSAYTNTTWNGLDYRSPCVYRVALAVVCALLSAIPVCCGNLFSTFYNTATYTKPY